MDDRRSRRSRFLAELKRRKVLTTGAGYAIVAWFLLQFGEVTFEPLHLPGWALTLLVVLVIAGFPVVLILAWFFDLTPRGFTRFRGVGDDAAAPEPAGADMTSAPGASVAVLAFEDMSAERDQDYLCDGIAEEILNRLAQIGELKVASRTSSFRFKGRASDIGTIARDLKVASVLEGSVRKAGDNLRITIQLISAADGFHLWTQSYDRQLDDIFEIQDEIAANVAAALQVTLTGQADEDVATSSVEAYDYYLRGQHYFHRWGLRNVGYAIDMFRRAVETDPEYARAWAALADCNAIVCMYWDPSAAHLEAVERASVKALELAPQLAETHVSRGLAHYVHERHEQAISEFEKALELDSELFDAHYFYGRVRFHLGELTEAARLFERASAVRPDDFQALIFLRQIYHSLGRDDAAREAARQGVERAERHLEFNPDDTRALNLGIGGFAYLGQRDKVLQWAERSLAIDADNADTLYNIACGYALIGESQKAIECLERSGLRGTSIGDWADNDSDLESLRDDPRFIEMIQRLKDTAATD